MATQTTITDYPDFMKPYLEDVLKEGQDLYNTDTYTPYTEYTTYTTYDLLAHSGKTPSFLGASPCWKDGARPDHGVRFPLWSCWHQFFA